MEVGMLIQTSYEKDAFDISANEWKRTGSSQLKVIKQQVKKKKHSIDHHLVICTNTPR